jgi:hypothetical protein
MYVIPAITVTDAMVTASTAPDSGIDEYPGIVTWTATSFSLADYVLHTPTQSVYRANDAVISTDVPGVSDKWSFVAKNNPLRMFDGKVSSQTIAEDGLIATLEPGGIVGSIAGFNISGIETINITVDGTPYDRTIQMIDNSGVTNEWWYFFAPIAYRTSFAIYDLPGEVDPIINIDFQTTAIAKVGEIVIGNRRNIGTAIDGSGFENDDLSYIPYDEFGNPGEPVIRSNRNILNYNVKIDSSQIGFLRATLESIGKTKKCVWAGSTDPFDDLLGFGFYETFSSIIYSGTSDVSIKVRTVI